MRPDSRRTLVLSGLRKVLRRGKEVGINDSARIAGRNVVEADICRCTSDRAAGRQHRADTPARHDGEEAQHAGGAVAVGHGNHADGFLDAAGCDLRGSELRGAEWERNRGR
ncbi:hypothetical protein SNK04_014079 [Fusarium graminearum]